MDELRQWGVEVVVLLQRASPALDPLARVLSALGDPRVLLLVIASLYWAYDRRWATHLGALAVVSLVTNDVLRGVLGQPRPFELDARVDRLDRAGGGGLPSGHAQLATVVWGGLLSRDAGLRWVAALVVGLVATSRVYLGAHLPHDVVIGVLLGVVLLAADERWGARVEAMVVARPVVSTLGVVGGSFLWAVVDQAVTSASVAGAAAGAAVGRLVESTWVGSRPPTTCHARLAAIFVGLSTTGFFVIVPSGFETPVGSFLGWSLVGAWITMGVPWLLARLEAGRR